MECVGEAFRQIPLKSIKRALIELDAPKTSAQNSEVELQHWPSSRDSRRRLTCRQIIEEGGNDNLFFDNVTFRDAGPTGRAV